ncbi:hypothetical protein MIR68_005067 [Amoeboaphelidium protococcarum]|nr:hypothetical protein MIR68_005067 [Amoeboaphelidium protococcarum]
MLVIVFLCIISLFVRCSSVRSSSNGVLVYLKAPKSARMATLDLNALSSMTKPQRRQTVFDHYTFVHQESLNQLSNILGNQLQSTQYESLWLVNALYIRDSTAQRSVIDLMSSFPLHDVVDRVEHNSVIAQIDSPIEQNAVQSVTEYVDKDGVLLSLKQINVDKVWDRFTRGDGVTVGLIDTGVNFTHPALIDNYRGHNSSHDYAWFDPKEFRDDDFWCDFRDVCLPAECCAEHPFDIVGHGTHVVGTMVGRALNGTVDSPQIGVAPGSQWIAAKGCVDGRCFKYGLIKSAEWMLCPTKIDGTEPRCDLSPDVVNNSWGSQNPRERIFEQIVSAWNQAGIISVFAIGNNGPSCYSTSAPGNFNNVFGVAAVDGDNRLTKFSSRGAGYESNEDDANGVFNRDKPDISAPGKKILSAASTAYNKGLYQEMSGTSMASPHVVGVIALVLSALSKNLESGLVFQESPRAERKGMEFNLLKEVVFLAANTSVLTPDGLGGRVLPLPIFPIRKECDRKGFDVWPNMFYGNGVVDALRTVTVALNRLRDV